MSILLEALRKSEREEHLGSVPGIYSQEAGDGGSGGRSPGRLGWLLMAVVFLTLAWLTWRQFAPEEITTDAAGVQAEIPTAAQATQTPSRDAVTNEISQAKDSGGDVSPAAQGPGADVRTPVETLPQDGGDALASSADLRQKSYGPAPGETLSAPAPAERSTQRAKPPQRVAEQTPKPATTPSASAQDPGQRNQQPPPVSYWQLPANIRNQLPELRITVLVFAEEPADRFVLLNGRRRTEGDQVTNGLRLEEIRRDGAIFTYRMYRFFVDQ